MAEALAVATVAVTAGVKIGQPRFHRRSGDIIGSNSVGAGCRTPPCYSHRPNIRG